MKIGEVGLLTNDIVKLSNLGVEIIDKYMEENFE